MRLHCRRMLQQQQAHGGCLHASCLLTCQLQQTHRGCRLPWAGKRPTWGPGTSSPQPNPMT